MLWHPFTQQQGWCEEDPLIIERADGMRAHRHARAAATSTASRRCGATSTATATRRSTSPIREQLDNVAHSTMLGPLAPAARSSWPSALVEHRAARPDPRLLLGQRLDGGRDRAEDGVPVLAAAGRRAAARSVRRAARTPTTATRSARSRSAASTCSTRCYGPLLFDALQAEPGDVADMARAARASTPGEVAAVIVEPLVQGAAGHARAPRGLPARRCASCATSTACC